MPVRNSSRAADGPIFGRTNGEITAGRMPSFVSVKPNTAFSSATAMSQMAASPAPPPSAAPWMRPITAAGSVSRAANISAMRVASRDVLLVRIADHPRHPLGIRAGAEDLARAAEHDHPQRRILRAPPRPGGQLGDDFVVEGVADVRPVQREVLDRAVAHG